MRNKCLSRMIPSLNKVSFNSCLMNKRESKLNSPPDPKNSYRSMSGVVSRVCQELSGVLGVCLYYSELINPLKILKGLQYLQDLCSLMPLFLS